jgi:DNA segregation ATPase FtsK/SpoIIIE, S-DNA-T family
VARRTSAGAASSRGGASARRTKARGGGRTLDLEAVGLVLLAFGAAIAGLLTPALPSGELGVQTRALLTASVGWGAWALPGPLIVLGALFLLRRNPPGWPRVLAGYALVALGAWGFVMLFAPGAAGSLGVSARAALTGAAGALAAVPAFVLLTLGLDLILGLRPTRILRGLLRALVRLVRSSWNGLVSWRARARQRAAFLADVAQVRRALAELNRDLAALEGLYSASGELSRWRSSVQEALATLRRPTPEALDDARGDASAWADAVGDFARDRAAELGAQLREEGARPELPEAMDYALEAAPGGARRLPLDDWARSVRAWLDEPFGGAPAAASGRRAATTDEVVLASGRALDTLRNGLVLELTALVDRHRRLARERDASERALAAMRPRQLARAYGEHAKRRLACRDIERAASGLAEHVLALEPWRDHVDALARAFARHPEAEELLEYDASLAEALGQRGREELLRLDGWEQALEAVSLRAREEQALRARQAQAQALAAAGAAADAADAAAGGGAGEQAGLGGDRGHGGADELEAALLDDRSVHLSEHAAWVTAPDGEPGGRPGPSPADTLDAAEEGPPWGPEGGDASRAGRPAEGRPRPRSAPEAAQAGADRPELPAVGGIPITLPGLDLLDPPEHSDEDPKQLAREVRQRVSKIDATLNNFKLEGRVVASVRGPSVTRFEVEPAAGEKISRFANLSDDLALAMAVGSVRIEAPIPGKSVIGLEVPNANRELIRFREAVDSPSFRRSSARLPIVLGKSIDGDMMVGDLARMPHLLLAGSTGSGKSVAVNALIASLLYRFLPTQLRFVMIDPKMVELTPFDGIPHLIRPVVTNPTDAAGVLLGAVSHMERRYKMMSKIGAKNLDQYNHKARNLDLPELPFLIVVIDELADLMITSPKEVESAIMRLAQMARATGMHLILATQRPSVDILTSLIKVNVPARMAFAVSSGFDSRTILDAMGAERLIGWGDMLFSQPGLVKPVRLQGPFVSETEMLALADFLRRQYFEDEFVEAYGDDFEPASPDGSDASAYVDWNDEKLRLAAELVISEGQASVSRLQRRLQVGHARAGKLMDSLEALGVVGPHTGSKPREVLIAFEELPQVFGR